jgi:hypothetical protein
MTPQSRKIKSTLAIALALGAIVPAAASARPLPADPPGWVGGNGPGMTQLHTPGKDAPQPYVLKGTHDVGTTALPASTTVVAVSSPSGFDWGDAGIGAAAGLGLSLLAVGGSVILVRRNGRHAIS